MSRNLLLLPILLLAGCSGCSSTDDKQRHATEERVAEADRQVGMPNITHWQERKLVKRIYEMRDQEDLVMYAYLVSLQGEPVFLFKCIGYGLPYSVQFTNPMRASGAHYALPQPEPNGLFLPPQADGTWLMMIDAKGETHPVYVEPHVIVSPVKLPSAKGNPAN